MPRFFVVAIPLALLPFGSCDCTQPADVGEGEGENGGEGEGEGEPRPDAGIPDPNTVGIETRPSNATCVAPARPELGGALDVVSPWPNIDLFSPLGMYQEPGTTTMYVIERGGRIVRWAKDDAGVADPELFGDISDRVLTSDSGGDERGLLGMAFHPDWPDVEEVYLSYNGFGAGGEPLSDVVSRFTLRADGTLDEDNEDILLEIPDFAGNHNGGMIAFSPTDPCRSCLYYGTGDGGDGNDPLENGQDPGTMLSKILRIDVDADDAPNGQYGIPADNPFVGVDGFAPETFAWGFRNPWRFSFDVESGDLWVGDVGQNAIEEIDLVEAGGNYGWDVFEGTNCRPDSPGDDCGAGGFEEPIVQYNQSAVRRAVTGGYVYRGSDMPSFVGTYLYADHVSSEVFALFFDAAGAPAPEVVFDGDGRIASFAEDADGEVYIIDHLAGSIEKLVLGDGVVVDNFPRLLSQTGCSDAANPALPSSGSIPYGTAHSLYSDDAFKERWMALPDGTQATILEDGDIDFPVGTVFRKDFIVDGERVETRLLVHHDGGNGPGGSDDWGGYSYEWNDDGTDATLLPPAGKTKTLANGQQWTYPSRNGCLVCHTTAAKRVLGLEVAQLNVGFIYPGEVLANQLRTLAHIELFDGPLPAGGDLDALPSLPPVDDVNASAEEKARAYLHVNCAICHRPGGIGVADTDWRFDTAFASMGLCNATPTEGTLGIDGALRMVPGDPSRSLVSLRMKRQGAGRMPLLGSVIVDEQGTAVIDEWISSLQGCDQ